MPPPLEPESGWSKERKALLLNVAVIGTVATYGLVNWDYGTASFQTVNEGWFGKRTSFGGADKVGHAYSAHLAAVGFASLYEGWGYERERADRYGAYTALGGFTLIEIGDGLSKNGFSYEDLIVDSTGIAFCYLRRRYPEIGRYVDFRAEYFPSEAVTKGGRKDIATDYSGFKWLLALKLGGFERLEDTWMQYLEFHVGYYTRGFLNADRPYYDDKSRHLYAGIGFNLSRLFRKKGYGKTATFLNFYQVPYTYLEALDTNSHNEP